MKPAKEVSLYMLRLAKPTDAEGILAIYAPYISNTSFTFETEVPPTDEFSNRITTYLQQWPWLVYEINGKIAGYAYASKYRERTAYQWGVESSIYIHDDHLKDGIGTKLYEALNSILKIQGFRNVYAVINLPNDRSVKFHEKCGYEYFATYEQVGYKLGQWKNVGWWRKIINDFGMDPEAPVKFEDLESKIVAEAIQRCNNS